jgi:hypothetical protein
MVSLATTLPIYATFVGLAVLVMTMLSIFLGLAWAKIGVKIRPDQDRLLIVLVTVMGVCGAIQSALSLSWFATSETSCRPITNTISVFQAVIKFTFYAFLTRRAQLVQYSQNAGKCTFGFVKVVVVLLFISKLSAAFVPQILTTSVVYFPEVDTFVCVISYTMLQVGAGIVLELILSFSTLYLFLKPLRAHMKETRGLNMTTMTANQSALQEVIARNFRGCFLGTAATIFVLLTNVLVSISYPGDFAALVGALGLSPADIAFNLCLLIYICRGAFELPKRFARLRGTSTQTGAASETTPKNLSHTEQQSQA